MQVGAIMSGPPWRVGLRTTQEVSPPRCGRQPRRWLPDQWNADSFVRAFAAVSVNAHNLCGRLSRAQGLCGNPEGCADGVRSHQAPEFSLVTEDQPCVVVAYANWYFQG